MTTNQADKVFAGSIPELYDRFMVPMIFQTYATEMAERIAALKPQRLLETAAGTGVLTRGIAARLPDTVIVATDLNQPMLDPAAKQLNSKSVEWRQADAQSLPFGDQEFDAVVCQFGVMFFPDKVQAYRETRRVLRHGQPFIFTAWDHIGRNELVTVVSDALEEMFPDDPPRFMERTPHGYHDVNQIRLHLTAAGFANVAIDSVVRRSRANTAYDAAVGYCQGSPWRAEIEARGGATGLQKATQHAADALTRRFGNGPIEGAIAALVITAR